MKTSNEKQCFIRETTVRGVVIQHLEGSKDHSDAFDSLNSLGFKVDEKDKPLFSQWFQTIDGTVASDLVADHIDGAIFFGNYYGFSTPWKIGDTVEISFSQFFQALLEHKVQNARNILSASVDSAYWLLGLEQPV